MNNISDGRGVSTCTGCGACVTVCPKDSIDYGENKFGFLEASVDYKKCIDCGKCKKVCLKYIDRGSIGKPLQEGKLYAAVSANEDVVRESTSGGIAYEIARYGIVSGYIVVGVVFDYKKCRVKTVTATSLSDIEKFKGSKYLQSYTIPCFKEIIERAKSHEESKYIVFGTPCQITGLRKAFTEQGLKNELITIDLFCHGVPSYITWNKYLDWLKEKHGINNIIDIKFRSKVNDWHEYIMEIESERLKYRSPSECDLFYKAFFDNILLNTACSKCVVRKHVSAADMRLGDFWGKKYLDNRSGVSAVLILSNAGQSLFSRMVDMNMVKIIEETRVDECLSSQSIHDYPYQEIHNKAILMLNEQIDLKSLIRKYRKWLPAKYRIVTALKEITGYMPSSIRIKLKKFYRKLS